MKKKIELLYVNFVKHPFLSGLEINLSQEFLFKFESDELSVEKLKCFNLFQEPIINFNLIVGENGVGKTTILNTVYRVLNGKVSSEIMIVVKRENKIEICYSIEKLKFNHQNAEMIAPQYKFSHKNEGFILEKFSIKNEDRLDDNNSDENKDEQDEFAISNAVYISNFIDDSINGTAGRLMNSNMLNFSFPSLLGNLDGYLDYEKFSRNSIPSSLSNYKLILKTHQIEFLAKENLKLEFKKPDFVRFNFNNLYYNLEEAKRNFEKKNLKASFRVNETILRCIDILLKKNTNDLIWILNVHLLFAIYSSTSLSNYSKYIINEEKYRKSEYFKENENSDFEKDRNIAEINYQKGVDKIIKDYFNSDFSDLI